MIFNMKFVIFHAIEESQTILNPEPFLQWSRWIGWRRKSLLFLTSTLGCVRIFPSIMVCIDCQHWCHLLFVYIFKHDFIDEYSHNTNIIVCLSLGYINPSTAIQTLLAHSDCIYSGKNHCFPLLNRCIIFKYLKFDHLITIFFTVYDFCAVFFTNHIFYS